MPTKGIPLNESRAHRARRLSMGDALGLTAALRAGGKPGDVPKFLPAGTPHPVNSPRNERGQLRAVVDDMHEQVNAMTFGEQFVEALGEFVDAREQYAHSRRGVGGEYANPDDMNAAGDRLQKLIDRRLP